MKKETSYIRTEKAIKTAFINLLKEKPFEKITVQDILEETPVSRGTFYTHFRDKYEIAERMQEDFFSLEKEVIAQIMQEDIVNYHKPIHKSLVQHRELVEALLKIHTEKVDLRAALCSEFEQKYLASSKSRTKETEAQIYAQAMTVIQMSYLNENNPQCMEYGYVENIMLEVLLYMLHIDSEEVREFFWKHVGQ